MSTYHSIKTYPIHIEKSLYNSNKSYRLIHLSNGILALLISNPSTDAAACSMCIATGSHNDPIELPGLAHFCEHMLFLGSKQFPNPNEFMGLIGSNGGNTNAFTTGEQTCFYYELPINQTEHNHELIFDYSLRNFSAFFKNPIFNYNLLNQEVNAINNEHDSNKSNINKIFYHGNLFTLNESPKINKLNIRNYLINYFQNYFQPNKMSLVIEGPQSLNHLQKLVVQNFNNIGQSSSSSSSTPTSSSTSLLLNKRKKSLSMDHSSTSSFSRNSISSLNSLASSNDNTGLNILHDSFADSYINFHPYESPQYINNLLYISSDNFNPTIRLIFPIKDPKMIKHLDFLETIWCNLLGDESKDSLCFYLKSGKNYISSIMMFIQDLTIYDKVLILELELTKNGEKHISNILGIIFNYIGQILSASSYRLIRYFKELKIVKDHSFYYQTSSTSIMDEVSHLSQVLQSDLNELGLDNILKGFKGIGSDDDENELFWIQLLHDFKMETENLLSINNFNIILISNQLQSIYEFTNQKHPTLEKDKYYHFDYKIVPFDPLQILEYQNKITELTINVPPTTNKFLSFTELELFTLLHNLNSPHNLESTYSENSMFQTKRISINDPPRLLDFSKQFEIWFKPEYDLIFKSNIITSLQFQTIEMESSPMTNIAMELLCYSWGLYANLTGTPSITLNLNGPKRDFVKVLQFIITEFLSYFNNSGEIPYKDLLKVRIKLRKEYQDLLVTNGIKQALAGSTMLLDENVWTIDERLDALEILDQSELSRICECLNRNVMYTRIFVNGDCNEDDVNQISKIINKLTNHERIILNNSPLQLHEPSSYLLTEGTDYVFEVTNTNKEDPLHSIYYYIQLGPRDDIETRTLGTLIDYMFSINLEYELRTKKQLGYSIFSGLKISRSTMGIYISILSGSFNPQELKEEIEKFIFNWELILQNYSTQEFESKLIKPFLDSQNENLEDSGIPSNLLYAMIPSMNSTNFINDSHNYRNHWNCFEKILSKTFRFQALGGKEEIDLNYIKSLSLSKFVSYFNQLVSVKSHSRSLLSILINSSMTNEQIEHNLIENQLSSYLENNGIDLRKSEILKILDTCNYDYVTVMNYLFKHYGIKEDKFKSYVSVIKQFGKSAIYNSKLMAAAKKNQTQSDIMYDMKSLQKSCIKRFGDKYSSNESVLIPTYLSDSDQLKQDSDLVFEENDVSPYHKLENFYNDSHEEDADYLNLYS
ncbi:Metalloenzyme, LuxS/M16 peptidase-like protein [Scheffersomyces coipomensis]|uniref:Metalloenzyme, LuxS/M16 peptidase-like protein n=1 Tax=Scheffersomyces coipomensis TaxID=1788519 RepID=UPI00315C951F